jgi:hypothetical protein
MPDRQALRYAGAGVVAALPLPGANASVSTDGPETLARDERELSAGPRSAPAPHSHSSETTEKGRYS